MKTTIYDHFLLEARIVRLRVGTDRSRQIGQHADGGPAISCWNCCEMLTVLKGSDEFRADNFAVVRHDTNSLIWKSKHSSGSISDLFTSEIVDQPYFVVAYGEKNGVLHSAIDGAELASFSGVVTNAKFGHADRDFLVV